MQKSNQKARDILNSIAYVVECAYVLFKTSDEQD